MSAKGRCPNSTGWYKTKECSDSLTSYQSRALYNTRITNGLTLSSKESSVIRIGGKERRGNDENLLCRDFLPNHGMVKSRWWYLGLVSTGMANMADTPPQRCHDFNVSSRKWCGMWCLGAGAVVRSPDVLASVAFWLNHQRSSSSWAPRQRWVA